jgi:hypothetical protein|nr:hypothetical protein [uncultured Romboutsia sp.]
MEQFALCDVVMTQIKVSDGTTHSFATADEISCEPVIEEGETKNLTIKNKLIASKQVPDMVLGHDITCKDNVFTPALLVDVQGGTVASSGPFTKYTAPNVGAMPSTKTFDFIVYVEVVGDDGATGEYLKYTFPNCKGSFISPNFKDGEYYANEYTIKSRPALNTSLYTVELVNELPVGVVAFKHPALEVEEEQIEE